MKPLFEKLSIEGKSLRDKLTIISFFAVPAPLL